MSKATTTKRCGAMRGNLNIPSHEQCTRPAAHSGEHTYESVAEYQAMTTKRTAPETERARCPSCGIPTIPDHEDLSEQEMTCDTCFLKACGQ